MTSTVRILRIALPIAFVAFVAVLVLSWRRSTTSRAGAAKPPVTSTQRPLDKPQAEAIAFEDVQTIGGRMVSRIRAARVVAFASGWSTLEGVQITIYRANGLTYDVVCPQAQYNSESKEAEAKGGVRLVSSDGMEVSTAEMRFDGSRLTNRMPVEFRVDRWRGTGGSMDLDIEAETLLLGQKVSATMEPAQEAEAPLTIDSAAALFRRQQNDVTFTENVVMNRAADRLNGDRVVGRFTVDRKTLVGIEGEGSIRMVMGANALPGEELGGRKEITSDRFFSDVTAEGEIQAITAVGDNGPARAILEGPPRRDITAGSFRVGLVSRAVRELKAEGQVVMIETGETRREVRVDRATVAFDPVRNRATSGFFEGNFKYRDPETQASSIRAHYDIAGDRILLTAEPGFDPTIISDGQTLKARQIEFAPKGGTSKATGAVIAELVSKGGGPSADGTSLFPGGKPVYVNSDVLIMRQNERTAAFSGNVRAWQETNTLFAADLQVQGDGQITARGKVRTVLYNAGSEARKVPMRTISEQLVVHRNERRVELLGDVTIEDESRTVTAQKATLHFDAQRRVERLEAEGTVVLTEKAANRIGTGDKASYLVKEKMAYLHGSPATATEPQGTLSGQQIVFDMNRNRVQVLSPTGTTEGTFKQQQ